MLLDDPAYLAAYKAEDVAAMKAVVASVDAMEKAKGAKLRDINWADVALKCCPDLYQLMYRSLSSDVRIRPSIPWTATSWQTPRGQITSFKSAPGSEGCGDAERGGPAVSLGGRSLCGQRRPSRYHGQDQARGAALRDIARSLSGHAAEGRVIPMPARSLPYATLAAIGKEVSQQAIELVAHRQADGLSPRIAFATSRARLPRAAAARSAATHSTTASLTSSKASRSTFT